MRKIDELIKVKKDLDKQLQAFFNPISNQIRYLDFKIENVHTWYGSKDSAFEFTMYVTDTSKKYHWAGEIVRLNFKVTEEQSKADFSAGAGGWNEEPADEVLLVFSSALNMAARAITVSKVNSFEIYKILKAIYETKISIFKEEEEIQKDIWEKKKTTIQSKIDVIMKDHTTVKSEDLIKRLETNFVNYNKIELIEVSYNAFDITFERIYVVLEKKSSKRFYYNGIAVSKKTLENFNYKNHFYNINKIVPETSTIEKFLK